MAQITRILWWRHLRSEPTRHVLAWSQGKLSRSGPGLAFWYLPMGSAIAEVPGDDRDLQFLFQGQANHDQAVTVQGVITYRIVNPELVSKRVDFSIDLDTGAHLKRPLDQLAALLTGTAQQTVLVHLARKPVRDLMTRGLEEIQPILEKGLKEDERLKSVGLEVIATRIFELKPSADLEKALQTPTRESIQQSADEATFSRRALAVEKERAIAENQMKTQIELAKREQVLIDQQGQNDRKRIEDKVSVEKIEADGASTKMKIQAKADADRIQTVESAKVASEKARMEVFKDFPPNTLLGLAAQELAGKLQTIEHLNITPDMLGPGLARLFEAGTAKLQAKSGK